MSNEVGRVSVRVIPNTRGFRRETNAQLRRLKDQLSELKVRIVPDLDKAFAKQARDIEKKPVEAKVKADLDGFQKRAQADLKKIALELDAKIPLTADGEETRKRIANEMRLIEGRIKAKIPVEPELAARERRSIQDAIDKLAREAKPKPLVVNVHTDTRHARSQVRELMQDLPKLAESGLSEIQVNINNDHTKAKLRELIAELKAEAALAGITIDVDIDTPAMRRGAIAAGSLGTALARAAKSGGGLSTVSRWGLIMAAGFVLAAPAVGLIVGLLSGLPALLGSIVAGVGAIALGMDGIKAAAAPLQPMLDSLKASVSQVFATQLPPIFEQLKVLLPTLQSGMQAVAGGLVSMFAGVTSALTSGAGIGNMNTLLQNTATLFTNLRPAAEQFTATFLQVAAAGSESFSRLSGVVNQFATEMSGVMTRMIDSGSFKGAIDGMSTALSGFLTLFSRLFEVGGTAMAKLGGPLSNMFSGLGDLLVALMPGLTSFSGLIANVVGGLGSSLAPVVAALTPAFTALADTLGPVLTQVFQALSPVLTQVATLLGDVLLAALQALAPYIPQIMSAFQQLGQALSEAFAQIGPALIPVIQMLIPVIVQLIPPVLQVVQALLPLIPAAAQVAAAFLRILAALSPLISVLAGAVAEIANVIAKFAEFGANIVTIVASAISIVVSTISGGMADFVNAIATGVSNAVAKVKEFGSQAVSAVSSFAGQMVSAGADLIRGLINGIKSMAGAALQAARDVASSVVGAVKGFLGIASPSKVFHQIGTNTVAGFTNGIADNQHLAADRAAGMAQGVVDGARKVITQGIDPLMVDVQFDPQALQRLKQEKDLLDLQAKTLGVQKDQAPDKMAKAALQAQLDQINARKREIALIQEQADYQKKYGDQVAATQENYASHMQNAMHIPYDFAKATSNQFLSDIGISGSGMLSELANIGLDYGSKFVFNVGNMDQALSAQQNIQRKEALRYGG